MTRVLIDQDITPTDRLLDRLDDDWETTVGIDGDEDALLEVVDEYDALLVTSRVPLTRDVIAAADRLKLIGKLGTGIDSVDLDAAREYGVTVTHTPGHNALSVAEHALCLTLACARRLPTAEALLSEGRWRDEYPLGTRVSGATVGIVGFGNVGKRVGKLLSGFDVDVLVSDPYVPTIDAELADADARSLDDLLERSDFVILTPELTDETRHLVGRSELDRMRDDAILVNVSRGPVVDEAALVDALRAEQIAGAGLDVFETEPLPADSPLHAFDNVVTTPHIAAMTGECRRGNIDQLAENVTRLSAGDSVLDRYVPVRVE
ncbi:NAD(P)-dependent oxidoreductase [Halobellus limi]|jgi:D-3-phosphoglycerate dehydrogenase|uniref:D-3-phosphoglycerate dehydrogenase n=1 Tax=Halobellus limi TaxID=699433 RepID=A0A1H6B805_9EURY|nr:hydroxyacid dehydrogenase [Halobellus limi]QCC49191.1 D-3-phosphoglycerate dehydrogenase [Halobellus limi]SEG56979.1 D-3-phosphoglycerate dehydrogenase [Halobellus limi]